MSKRRENIEGVQTRAAILDATENIMREDGYAAVSARKVAQAAGLKSQLVIYHFGSMDELFLALYHRTEERYLAALAGALAAKNPLRALWRLGLDTVGTTLAMEFMALANHRKTIRAEIARAQQRYHSLQTAALARFLEDRGVDRETLSPEFLSFLIGALARALASESALGASSGHPLVEQSIEHWLQLLERGGGSGRVAS